jgi:leucyl-tRNA synthetase
MDDGAGDVAAQAVGLKARNAANADIETAVLALEWVKRALAGKPPKKVIVVPQRIVNVVA